MLRQQLELAEPIELSKAEVCVQVQRRLIVLAHIEVDNLTTTAGNEIERRFHQPSADPLPTEAIQNGHVADLPPRSASTCTVEADIAHDLAIVFPHEPAKDAIQVGSRSVEQIVERSQPAQESDLTQHLCSAARQFLTESILDQIRKLTEIACRIEGSNGRFALLRIQPSDQEAPPTSRSG